MQYNQSIIHISIPSTWYPGTRVWDPRLNLPLPPPAPLPSLRRSGHPPRRASGAPPRRPPSAPLGRSLMISAKGSAPLRDRSC